MDVNKENPMDKFKANAQQDNANESAVNEKNELDDNSVFEIIKTRAGIEVASWEDLKPKEVIVEKDNFASDEIKTINKYVSETGRNVEDFFKLHKDWSKVDSKELVMDNMRRLYPTLSDEEIQDMFNEEYAPEEYDEEIDDEADVKRIKRQNKLKQAKLNTEADKVRNERNAEKTKYSVPVKSNSDNEQAAMSWAENMGKAIDGIALSTEDGFNYEFQDKGKFDFLKDIKTMFNPFRNEKGEMDYQKLALVIARGMESETLLKEYSKFVKAETIKEEMARASNRGNQYNPSNEAQPDEEWKRDALAKLTKFNRKY